MQTLVDENKYEAEMQQRVLPALASCARDGWVEPFDSALPARFGRLHYVWYDYARFASTQVSLGVGEGTDTGVLANADAAARAGTGVDASLAADAENSTAGDSRNSAVTWQGTVVISHGFTEFAEKYAEIIFQWLSHGYNVCMLEHRGHGHSARDIADPHLVWIDSWRRYVDDLAHVITTVVRPNTGNKPVCLYSHSMGGGIAASMLELYPGIVDVAVLSSPMIQPQTAGLPAWLARALGEAACWAGWGAKKVIGQQRFSEAPDWSRYDGASMPRMRRYHRLRVENVDYQTNCATFQWVREAMRMSSFVLNPVHCAALRTPTLLIQAGRDSWVSNDAQNLFIDRANAGRSAVVHRIQFSQSLHEVFSMPNDMQEEYWQSIFEFVK